MLGLEAICAFPWTNYLVDAIVVALFVILGLVCAKKGFIACLFDFAAVIAALLAAILFTKLLIGVTGGLFGLQDVLTGSFQDALLKIKGFDIDISTEGINAALAEKNLPQFMIDIIMENYSSDVEPGTTLAFAVGNTLSGLSINLITFVLIFVAVRLAMILVKKILTGLVNKISLIAKVNYLLGFAVGVVEAFLILNAVLAVLALIPSEAITGYLDKSIIVGWMYNNNVLNIIMGWILV